MNIIKRLLDSNDSLSSLRLAMMMIVTTDCLSTFIASISMAWHGQDFGLAYWGHLTADVSAVLAVKGWQKVTEVSVEPTCPPICEKQ